MVRLDMVRRMKPRAFNKMNLKRVADNLFYDDGKYFHYMPLCHGTLAKANGEITHCAIGEMYEYFTGKKIARRIQKKDLKEVSLRSFDEIDIDTHINDGHMIMDQDVVIFHSETDIIKSIIALAELKDGNEYHLKLYLDDIPEVNDCINGNGEQAQIRRAKAVQKFLYKIADEALA